MITYTVTGIVAIIAAGIVTILLKNDYEEYERLDWFLVILDVAGAIVASGMVIFLAGYISSSTTWKNESITLVDNAEVRVQKSQHKLFGENKYVVEGDKTRTLVYDVHYSKDGIDRELVHKEPYSVDKK